MEQEMMVIPGQTLDEWQTVHDDRHFQQRGSEAWMYLRIVQDEIGPLFSAVRVVDTRQPGLGLELPVFGLVTPGLEVRLYYNLRAWYVSIRADRHATGCHLEAINRDEVLSATELACLPAEWRFGSYLQDPHQYTVRLWCGSAVATYLRALVNCL